MGLLSETHVLNEEVFGTVAFIGLSRANTWEIMGLLDCKPFQLYTSPHDLAFEPGRLTPAVTPCGATPFHELCALFQPTHRHVLHAFTCRISVAYEHDFDAIAITPPGHGNTTQVEDEGGGFWSSSNFLKHAVESCLGVSLARTVVVSHSNFVTRKYFLPFLMVRLSNPECL